MGKLYVLDPGLFSNLEAYQTYEKKNLKTIDPKHQKCASNMGRVLGTLKSSFHTNSCMFWVLLAL